MKRWFGIAVVVVLGAVVLISFFGKAAPECRSVNPAFVEGLDLQGVNPGPSAAIDYDTELWLVAVQVDGADAVWATNIDPSIVPTSGVTIGANDAARQVSTLGVDVGPAATHPVAVASRDEDAITNATACLES